MLNKISSAVALIVKYCIFAAVLASFVFIGWRIVTKGAYVRQERFQCRAVAVSAARTAAEALLRNGAAARAVSSAGGAEYIVDHMNMPGNYIVVAKISPHGKGFAIETEGASGWNSRSPQKYLCSAELSSEGKLSFAKKEDAEFSAAIEAALPTAVRAKKKKLLSFVYPFEKKCPAPFGGEALEIRLKDNTAVVIVYSD